MPFIIHLVVCKKVLIIPASFLHAFKYKNPANWTPSDWEAR